MEKNNFGLSKNDPSNLEELLLQFDIIQSKIDEIKTDFSSLRNVKDYNGPKIVIYAATPNRYKQMERSAKTLIANSEIDKVFFLTEHDEYPDPLPDIIETINVKEQNYFPEYNPNIAYWTYMALMRLAFHRIFPMYDRVLWLDTDTIIVGDISQVFDTPLGDYYYFAAVKENRRYIQFLEMRKIETREVAFQAYPQIDYQDYYNSGVLLENLKLLRDSGMGDKLISRINNYKTGYPDQNVINNLCRNHIFTLSNEYNWSYFTGDTDIPKIIHCSSGKMQDDVQEIASMYDELTFEQIMEQKNRTKLVYDPNKIKNVKEITEDAHWNIKEVDDIDG